MEGLPKILDKKSEKWSKKKKLIRQKWPMYKYIWLSYCVDAQAVE